MQTYISILRGINVSGHKLIKMDALRNLYAELNFSNVQTYIQSGNVIFKYKKTKTTVLETTIAKKITQQFGFEVPVMVKDVDEISKILANNPFLTNRKLDETKLHLTFLSEAPQKNLVEKLKETPYANDEFIVIENAVYLFCPNGYGNTKLTNTFFETKLKLTATTRNWKTVNQLYTMSHEINN